jgi:hypothetical protein
MRHSCPVMAQVATPWLTLGQNDYWRNNWPVLPQLVVPSDVDIRQLAVEPASKMG